MRSDPAEDGKTTLASSRIEAAIKDDRKNSGRGRGIRTPDIQLPKLALYQTELYPDALPADIRDRKRQWYGAVRAPVNVKQAATHRKRKSRRNEPSAFR